MKLHVYGSLYAIVLAFSKLFTLTILMLRLGYISIISKVLKLKSRNVVLSSGGITALFLYCQLSAETFSIGFHCSTSRCRCSGPKKKNLIYGF